jgi:hypothetical protein
MESRVLKWVIGVILALLVIVAGTCWYGFTKLTAGGDTASVVIATTPGRAWSYLSNPDSLTVWQDSASGVRVWSMSDSALRLGDSMWVGRLENTTGDVRRDMAWVLTRLEPQSAMQWSAVDDSTGTSFMGRTDSLAVRGDSVEITITYAATLFDSLMATDSVGGLTGRLLGGTSAVMVSAMRLTSEGHLRQLKRLLERP